MKKIKKLLSITLAGLISLAVTVPAFAQNSNATINIDNKCSLEIFKYDLTEAEKAGAWTESSSYVSTGYENKDIEKIKKYAIKGVEFTIIPVADILQFTNENTISLLYGFNKSDSVLKSIGLADGENRVAAADSFNSSKWYFNSDVLNKALKDKLSIDEVTTKNELEGEAFKRENKKVMPLTDENGRTKVENLDVGLYLVIETKVPENVVDSTNPFFLSLPMTDPEGENWNYDVVAYPKNETGDPTLDKKVKEVSFDNNTKDFDKYATGSIADLMEYQITSTIPKITSKAVYLSKYTFVDTIKGLNYKQDYPIKIDFYKDAAMTKKISTWDITSKKFTVDYNFDIMTITMSESGLSEINKNYSEHLMVISYGAYISQSAIIGQEGNPNSVSLTWERTSKEYTDTLTSDSDVYTFGIDISKLFSDIDSQKATKDNLFNEVEFTVMNKTDNVYINAKLNEKGIYEVTGYTNNKDSATVFKPTKTDFEYGKIKIKGLENDEYIITEINTAKGYMLLKDPINVKINFSNNKNARATVNGNNVAMSEDGASINAYAELKVVNHRGYDLPSTGDNELWKTSIIFAALLIIAIIGISIMHDKSKSK